MTTRVFNADELIIDKFKKILDNNHINYKKVYLFGSRVTGHIDDESDWDFLVILKNKIKPKKKHMLTAFLRIAFHEYFPVTPVDIIIKDEDSFEQEKDIINTISNEIYSEGVEI